MFNLQTPLPDCARLDRRQYGLVTPNLVPYCLYAMGLPFSTGVYARFDRLCDGTRNSVEKSQLTSYVADELAAGVHQRLPTCQTPRSIVLSKWEASMKSYLVKLALCARYNPVDSAQTPSAAVVYNPGELCALNYQLKNRNQLKRSEYIARVGSHWSILKSH